MGMIPREFVQYVYAELTEDDKELLNQAVANGENFDEALDRIRKVIGFNDTRTGKFYPKKEQLIKESHEDIELDPNANGVDVGEVGFGDIDFDNEIEFDL